MALDFERAAARQRELDDEMVALSVASTVAYFHLAEARKQVDSSRRLSEIVPLVAAALSQVAPIYRVAQAGASPARLSAPEVAALLFRRREEAAALDLDQFTIRRGDLRSALATLREAYPLFGNSR